MRDRKEILPDVDSIALTLLDAEVGPFDRDEIAELRQMALGPGAARLAG